MGFSQVYYFFFLEIHIIMQTIFRTFNKIVGFNIDKHGVYLGHITNLSDQIPFIQLAFGQNSVVG